MNDEQRSRLRYLRDEIREGFLTRDSIEAIQLLIDAVTEEPAAGFVPPPYDEVQVEIRGAGDGAANLGGVVSKPKRKPKNG